MAVLEFIINEVFGQGSIFLALIAMVGLILQKKPFTEVVRGTAMTAFGFLVLNTGTSLITDKSIDGLIAGFGAVMPQAAPQPTADIVGEYGSFIGAAMLAAFIINILVARFTKWKTIFLTGHMLSNFPFFFLAAGVDAGLRGIPLLVVTIIFTTLYLIVCPNLMRPLVKEVTGKDNFSIGHPTTFFSVLSGYLGKLIGDKSKSTEDLKFPKGLGFLKEITITGSLIVGFTYIVMFFVMKGNGVVPADVWGCGNQYFTYIFTHAANFGVGLIIMLQGIRMEIGEILPAFKGFADKLVPDAIPALDCPTIFSYAPNALMIGFITSMITSIITIILTYGMFPTVVVPLTITCFFEIGCAAIIANATGGIRACIICSALCGVLMVFLVGIGANFFNNTIQPMLLVYGGQDFDLWGIVVGLVSRALVSLGL